MNILLLAEREINPIIGGIERVSHILAQNWQAQGASVYCLALNSSEWNGKNSPAATQFYLPQTDSVVGERNIGYVRDLVRNLQIDVLLNQATIREDVVDLCNEVRKYTSVKLVSALHFAPNAEYQIARNNLFLNRAERGLKAYVRPIANFLYFYLRNGKRIIERERRILKKISQGSNRVVILSGKYFSDFRGIFDSEKYQVIPNPLPLVENTSAVKKSQLLYVGRIEYGGKRFDRMLDIWNSLFRDFPEWELVVVGDGGYLQHFKEETLHRGIRRVRYEGFCDPEPFYETASILCLTSTCEGFGMVLPESMQYGCIPVSYNSFAALSDIIEDGVNGFAIRPFNREEYVRKLALLMRNEELRKTMAAEALKVPPRFDANKIARQWLDLFGSLQ